MLTDDVLQRMYELAPLPHPDNGIALSVTLDACDRIRSCAGCRIGVEAVTGSNSQRPVSRNTVCISPQTRANASKSAGVQAGSRGTGRPPMITWCATWSTSLVDDGPECLPCRRCTRLLPLRVSAG